MKRINVVSIQMVKEKSLMHEYSTMNTPEVSADIFRSFIGNVDREVMVVACVDQKLKVNALSVVSIGTLSASLASSKEVLKPAILANSAGIILCHNHPSGDPTPSEEDKKVTKRIKSACELMDMFIADHLILGDYNKYYSFREEGGL